MYMDELAAGALQKWVTAIALRGERINACTGDANSRRIDFTIESPYFLEMLFLLLQS
jgi:hypothetical protein